MGSANGLLLVVLLSSVSIVLFGQPAPKGLTASYAGSTVCKICHAAIYERWNKTRMANVVTDPKVHPEVILPDLKKSDDLLTFTLDDIARSAAGDDWAADTSPAGIFRK